MDASRSESSGSLSPDLCEIWGYGCSTSPTCGSQSDLDKSERPKTPEKSDAHGSGSFKSSVTYGVQTAMVRGTLWPTVADEEVWPKTYYEWNELWPDPLGITEEEVGAMLDDFDCTNDVKPVNITNTSKTIDPDIRLN